MHATHIDRLTFHTLTCIMPNAVKTEKGDFSDSGPVTVICLPDSVVLAQNEVQRLHHSEGRELFLSFFKTQGLPDGPEHIFWHWPTSQRPTKKHKIQLFQYS